MNPIKRNKWLLALVAVMCIALGAGSAWAQTFTFQGGGLGSVGPLNAIGYPSFIADKAGTALEPCLVQPTTLVPVADPCALAGTLLGPGGAVLADDTPIVFTSAFPQEFFYQNATAILSLAGGRDALIIMAVEGGFTAPLLPTPGQQVVFVRTRLRVNGGLIGGQRYRAVYPFGEIIFTAAADGTLKQITTDVGCLAAPCGTFQQLVPNAGATFGPFLTAVTPAPPAGYVGDPGIDQTVTGSPTGNNLFRIEQIDANGNVIGQPVGQTEQFALWGKLFTGTPATPTLTVDRASYVRNTAGMTVSVFARSVGAATVTATVHGTTINLSPDSATGRWFGQALVPLAVAGDPVNVTADNGNGCPAGSTTCTPGSLTLSKNLTDEVTIDAASYAGGVLTVTAHSSDATQNPRPVLTAAAVEDGIDIPLGTLAAATNTFTLTTQAPPALVAVTSANGGSAERAVEIGLAATQTATTTTLTSSKNPSLFGDAVTFSSNVTTAAGGQGAGSVNFFDGSTLLANVPLVSGIATVTTPSLARGSHQIVATYVPSDPAAFKNSSSPILVQVVNGGTSTTAVSVSPNPTVRRASVTATATVSPTTASSGGSVTFTLTSPNGQVTTLGAATVNASGVASLTFTTPNQRGTFTVTASYGGNVSLNPSAGTTTLTIN